MCVMSVFVGIDVSKATLDLVLLTTSGTQHQQFPNTVAGFEQLHQWLKTQPPITRMGMEASGRYGEGLLYFLLEQGYPVSYLNPKQIHAFAEVHLHYNKTDKQDALLIARYCQLHQPPLWQPTSPLQRQLQQRSRRLHALQKMRQQEVNRLHAGLTDPFVVKQIRLLIAYFDRLIAQTQQAMHALVAQSQTLRRQHQLLVSIKGIGDKTATLLLAELGDITRFDTPRQLAAFIGLTPQHFQSGTSVRKHASISRQGNARVRAALYMPAIVAKRWNPPCRAFAQRMEQAKKPGKVIIVALMRKLVHQIFGILKSGRPFDPHFGFAA